VIAGEVAPGWTLRYAGLIPAEEGLREALCTVGNGYFATRGAAPESRADGTHYPGTYVAGCYNQLQTDIAGCPVVAESLVNAPNWLPLTFAAGDGPWLDLAQVEVLQHQQELDLRHGVLTRRLRIRDGEGRGDVLRLDPFWPKRLGTLKFSIFYRDHAITLRIEEHAVRVSSGPGNVPPVRVSCRGQMRDLRPGHSVEFSLPGRFSR
jgi:trehalose/maltose hydrolase-like predicted phosphorylase